MVCRSLLNFRATTGARAEPRVGFASPAARLDGNETHSCIGRLPQRFLVDPRARFGEELRFMVCKISPVLTAKRALCATRANLGMPEHTAKFQWATGLEFHSASYTTNSPERNFQHLLLPSHLVERNDGPEEGEENHRQHQLAPGACDEVWQR
jgi:hypothetical protein